MRQVTTSSLVVKVIVLSSRVAREYAAFGMVISKQFLEGTYEMKSCFQSTAPPLGYLVSSSVIVATATSVRYFLWVVSARVHDSMGRSTVIGVQGEPGGSAKMSSSSRESSCIFLWSSAAMV